MEMKNQLKIKSLNNKVNIDEYLLFSFTSKQSVQRGLILLKQPFQIQKKSSWRSMRSSKFDLVYIKIVLTSLAFFTQFVFNLSTQLTLFQQMRNILHFKNPLLNKWMNMQANMVLQEDSIYRKAFLAGWNVNNYQQTKQLEQLQQTTLDMTMIEQEKYSQNIYLEYLYKNLISLHKHSRSKSMISTLQKSSSKSLVDPDKFPIWDLTKKVQNYRSTWGDVMGRVRYDLGYQMLVRESRLQHPESGKGVFLFLAQNTKKITAGSMLGFVSGKLFDNYPTYRKQKFQTLKSYEKNPQHLHFPSGKVIELGNIIYHKEDTEIQVDPSFINPYALGHMINHPPPGIMPNVFFCELSIPFNFFPKYLLRYLPYEYQKEVKQQQLDLFVILALRDIQDKQQLYVNYHEQHVYQLQTFPEWMLQPPQLPTYYFKTQYENSKSSFWQLVEKSAMKKKQKQYQEYFNKIKYKPEKILYEDQKFKYTELTPPKNPHQNK